MSVRAKKRFGQHFLNDTHVINSIIDHIPFDDGQTLVEIGPGTGALTRPLLARVRQLHVIEIDKDLATLLESRLGADGKLVIHRQDVLRFDFCDQFSGPLTIIGNLPYNISTPLLFHLLDQAGCIGQMIFMLQKEVADRICAEPGSGDYGRLSIMVQSQCRTEWLLNVGPESFSPPPRVDSAVIRLYPQEHPGGQVRDRKLFNNLVRIAFTKRRKTIRNALKTVVSEEALIQSGINPAARPEEIPVETYIRLANIVVANFVVDGNLQQG
jgi:16S rRNA (adenine1518-N6/adenine1519-N6)-dimethyltransferase